MNLSQEQQRAYDLVIQGKNLFLTGPGGSGKSKWIQTVYSTFPKRVQVCALTGCAAILLNCNAKTIHSWAGIGLGDSKKAITSPYSRKRWKNIDLLIIDEVSMMSVELLEMLNCIGQTIRKSSAYFGGIQVVFCGDFYQLPPINSPFCFESPLWDKIFLYTVCLTTIYRQKSSKLQEIMSQIRDNKLTYENNAILQGRLKEGIDCVKLVPTRQLADAINSQHYEELSEKEHTFTMKSIGEKYNVDYLKKNILCPEQLRLKLGAKVMCIANIDEKLCNGSQGTVIDFTPFPVVQFSNETRMMSPHSWSVDNESVTQVPLIYAWALTIHKAQGATLEKAELDLGNGIFEYGQIYVALSRLTDLEGLYLTAFNSSKIKSHPKVIEFYNKIKSR